MLNHRECKKMRYVDNQGDKVIFSVSRAKKRCPKCPHYKKNCSSKIELEMNERALAILNRVYTLS